MFFLISYLKEIPYKWIQGRKNNSTESHESLPPNDIYSKIQQNCQKNIKEDDTQLI